MLKKLILIILILPCFLFAQEGIQLNRSVFVYLDSTETGALFIPFFAESGNSDPDTSRISFINSSVSGIGKFVYLDIDSISATAETDSFSAWAYYLGHDGKRISDIIYFDFANHDTAVAQQWLDFTPFNETGNVTHSAWVDLSSVAPDAAFGIEIGVEQAAADSVGTNNKVTAYVPTRSY